MKRAYLLLAILFLAVTVWAQSPQRMSYQAVVRDNDNSLVVKRSVGVKISIAQGTDNGTTVYSELFNPNPETNANGLLTLEIGGGTPVSGTFSEIDWSKGPFFIRTEIDPKGGSNYSVTGTGPLLSVPFALHAHSVENDKVDDADSDPANEIQQLSLSGTKLSLSKGGGSVTLPAPGENSFSLPYTGSAPSSDIALSISGGVTGILGESLITETLGIMPAGIFGRSIIHKWGVGVMGIGKYAGFLGEGGVYGVSGKGSTGVFGESYHADGIAVHGLAFSTTGTTYGVKSEVKSDIGFSGYFTGGKFYVNGRVGLGTESPAATLHIHHTNATAGLMPDQGLRIQNRSGTNRFWTLYTFSSNGALALYSGTGDDVSVGNFNAGTGAYTATSNRHLKTNISLLDSDILDKIALLKPARYSYLRDPMNQMTIGFMAEDVQPLFPELVDAVGENSENMAINYAGFSVVAIKAIQQQQQQISALKEALLVQTQTTRYLQKQEETWKAENEQMKKRLERLEILVASTAEKGNE